MTITSTVRVQSLIPKLTMCVSAQEVAADNALDGAQG